MRSEREDLRNRHDKWERTMTPTTHVDSINEMKTKHGVQTIAQAEFKRTNLGKIQVSIALNKDISLDDALPHGTKHFCRFMVGASLLGYSRIGKSACPALQSLVWVKYWTMVHIESLTNYELTQLQCPSFHRPTRPRHCLEISGSTI